MSSLLASLSERPCFYRIRPFEINVMFDASRRSSMSILIGSAFLTMLSLTLLLSCSSSGGPSLTESTSHQHQHQRQYGTAPDAIIEGMPSSSTSHALLPLPTTRSKDASSTADSAKSPSPESISFKHVSQVVNSPEVSIQHEVKPIDQLTFVLPCEECSENSGVPYPVSSSPSISTNLSYVTT